MLISANNVFLLGYCCFIPELRRQTSVSSGKREGLGSQCTGESVVLAPLIYQILSMF